MTRISLNGNRFRQARFGHFMALVDSLGVHGRPIRVLDVGGSVDYWTALEPQWRGRDLEVTIINIVCDEPLKQGRFTLEQGDACSLRFEDASFDVVHSNSVIEHVGPWPRMQQMAAEVRRVAPHYFVQTPNLWFPIEPHFRTAFFQFLPTPVGVALLQRRKLGYVPRKRDYDEAMEEISSVYLIGPGELRHLFPGCTLVRERFAGMTKSITAIG